MSLIASMFFVGTFVGSFILPRCADIFGRKPMFLFGLSIYILDCVALYFVNNLYLLYFLMFMGGISETGRYYVAYVYAVEMMPKEQQNKTGLYIFMVFGFAMTYIALQFWFLTKDVFVNNFIAFGLATVSLVAVTLFMPESPRFLFSRKEFAKCKDVIGQIAKVNGTEDQISNNFDFEVELNRGESGDDSDTTKEDEDSRLNKSETSFITDQVA